MKKFAKLLSSFISAAMAINFAAPAVSVVLAESDDTISSLSETIEQGLRDYSSTIDIKKFGLKVDTEQNKADSIKRITDTISYLRKVPDMFSVQYESSMQIQLAPGNDGAYVVSGIKIKYTNTKEEADALRNEVYDKIDRIIEENITPGMTELQKALVLHDYLVLNTTYDLGNTLPDGYEGYTAYDILVFGNGVCEGYSQAYNMLLERVGISSIMVVSDAMNHAWNLVNIDGEWYHADVTWDDPVPDSIGRSGHGYFLLSDKAFAAAKPEAGRNRAHTDWNSKGIKATSEKYDNAFWQTVTTEIFTRGDQWYFVNKNGEYSRYTESTGAVDTWISLCEEKWYVWGQYSAYWDGKYISLVVAGDKVYYNSPTQLYVMNLDGSEKMAVGNYINPYETNGYVYGLKLNDGKIYAVIKQKPEDSGTFYEIMSIADAGIDETKKYSFIESLVDIINSMPDGSSRSFDFREETVLPAEAINAMRNRDITLTFDLGDYSWDIKGKNVKPEETGDLNLEIRKDQGLIPENMIAKVARKNSSVVELDLQHEGLFGLKANINYLLGSQFSNSIAELYSYDSTGAKMDKMDTAMVDSKGGLQIELDKSSCYALVLNNAYLPMDTQAPQETTASAAVTEPAAPVSETGITEETKAPEVTTVPETTIAPQTTSVTEQTVPSETTAPAETAAPVTTAASVTTPVPQTTTAAPASVTTPAVSLTTTAAPVTTAVSETTAPPVTTAAVTAQTPPPVPVHAIGDADGSGTIDISDLTTLALYLLGEINLTDAQISSIDVTGDGIVDLTDLATLKQFISHKIDKFR
ncbi:dockerin type I repeat-containing protein [Ruminococcus sp. HUN007]|uniref:dockerin type I repeat-containing protein n=1 Tax=Ruminococcus sp. HUN007 TaxID=1514668 RepID=UPI0006784362|nr:dockerin type I repeat-containing protein [Ruminococcus sp. HUN007]